MSSFSGEVKDELSRQQSSARHCQIAELTAILTMCGGVRISAQDRYTVSVHTENLYVARKFSQLLKRTFRIASQAGVRSKRPRTGRIYTVAVPSHEDSVRILKAADLLRSELDIGEETSLEGNDIVRRTCCARAFLRGAFLAAGSVSDPRKSYHFEVVCQSAFKAEQLAGLIRRFDLDARTVQRKSHYIVYLKEGAQIVDMLGVMEATRALMNMENVRILREISNTVNRQVNCETANLEKTVNAAVRQVEDITYLQRTLGLKKIPENLRQTASLRLAHPDVPLRELGQMHDPPVGKSGVNHRLRRLSEIAREVREKEETNVRDFTGFPS